MKSLQYRSRRKISPIRRQHATYTDYGFNNDIITLPIAGLHYPCRAPGAPLAQEVFMTCIGPCGQNLRPNWELTHWRRGKAEGGRTNVEGRNSIFLKYYQDGATRGASDPHNHSIFVSHLSFKEAVDWKIENERKIQNFRKFMNLSAL